MMASGELAVGEVESLGKLAAGEVTPSGELVWPHAPPPQSFIAGSRRRQGELELQRGLRRWLGELSPESAPGHASSTVRALSSVAPAAPPRPQSSRGGRATAGGAGWWGRAEAGAGAAEKGIRHIEHPISSIPELGGI